MPASLEGEIRSVILPGSRFAVRDGSAAELLRIQVPGAGAGKPNSRKRHPGLYVSCSPVEIHRKQAIHLVKQCSSGEQGI